MFRFALSVLEEGMRRIVVVGCLLVLLVEVVVEEEEVVVVGRLKLRRALAGAGVPGFADVPGMGSREGESGKSKAPGMGWSGYDGG